ncbi:MAG: hypothetical protein SGARI_000115, partial [Bacillariaceae sp.]
FYWSETLARSPQKSILVARQESLENDLQDLEQFLVEHNGGAQNAAPLQFHPNDSIHFVSGKVSTTLHDNKQQRNILCCTLFRDEWPIYALLIKRAENLSMEQKVATLQSAWAECGAEKHPADIEAMLQAYTTPQGWSQAFMGDVCRKFYADDDAIAKDARKTG